jgi:hypothetical protein
LILLFIDIDLGKCSDFCSTNFNLIHGTFIFYLQIFYF